MPDGVSLTWDDTAFQARLQDYINVLPQDAEKILFRVAARVLADIKAGWPVDTGASRAGWIGPRKIAPLAYQLSNPFTYARVIEYGGYMGSGPKVGPAGGETLPGGVTVNRGLYPRQRPAAPVRRALAKAYGQITLELDKRLLGQFSS
jgi:hypothetical protein